MHLCQKHSEIETVYYILKTMMNFMIYTGYLVLLG